MSIESSIHHSHSEFTFHCRSDGNRRHYLHIRMRNLSSKCTNWYTICSKQNGTNQVGIFFLSMFTLTYVYILELLIFVLKWNIFAYIFLPRISFPCVALKHACSMHNHEKSEMKFHWYSLVRIESREVIRRLQITITFGTFLFLYATKFRISFPHLSSLTDLKFIFHSSNVRWYCILYTNTIKYYFF